MGATTLEYVVRVLQGTASLDELPQRRLFHAPEGPVIRALDVHYTWVDATNIALLEEYSAQHVQAQVDGASRSGSRSRGGKVTAGAG